MTFSIPLILIFGSLIGIFSYEGIIVAALNDPPQLPSGGMVYVNGDWEVTDIREYYNCTIVMNGSLIVKNGGSLTLRNVTLIMNNTFNGSFNIEVQSGGSFYISDFDNSSSTNFDNSNITSANPEYHYMFRVKDGANFTMKNSELHECGWASSLDEGLTIESDGVIIDNNTLSDNWDGICLWYSSNNTITNNDISNNYDGIYFWYSSGNIITNNTISNRWFGLNVFYSSDNTIARNNISNNYRGIDLNYAPRTIIANNSICSNRQPGIATWESVNTTIINNTISNNQIGLDLRSLIDYCTVSGNTISSNEERGIVLLGPSNCIITNNTIISNKLEGFYSRGSSYNMVINNTISDNNYGIYLEDSSNNTIGNNTISNNWKGIYQYSSSNNRISNNSILGNAFLAISSESGIDAQFNYWGTTDLSKIERMVENVNFLNPLDTSPTEMDLEFITGNAFWSGSVYLERGVIVEGSLTIDNADIVFNNTKRQNFIQVNMNMIIDDSNIDSNFGNYTILYTNNSHGAITNSSLTHQKAITTQANNFTIDNNTINRGSHGIICMKGSTGNTIIKNNVSLNIWYSVLLWYSPSNRICDNNISSNWEGAHLWYSPNNYIANNTLSSNEFRGVFARDSSGITITNNTVSSNGNKGIYFLSSSNCKITKNIISLNNLEGVAIAGPSSNIITNNNISNNWKGIYLSGSSNNIFTDNIIFSNNWMGVHLLYSSSNIFHSNNISSNNNYNFYLEDSSHNRIYHNNIVNHTNQAYDNRDDNYWDDGYPSGGNYWSDYIGVDNFKGPNQDQPGSDGIGDTNYSIDSDSIDNYPLMEPYTYKPLENYTVLKQGWNLISIPLIQEKQNLQKVLEMIDGYYDAVQWYDITDPNNPWKHNKVDKSYGTDLFEINETMGFWIHITPPGDTIFLYNGTQPTSNLTIPLHSGWNMVGYPSLTSYNRTEGLNNLTFDDQVDAIWSYNAATQKWEEMGESDYFIIGRGYYIHAKSECEWEVPL